MIHSRTTWQDRFASGVEDKEGAWVKFSTKTSDGLSCVSTQFPPFFSIFL
jgi:hypothetical protein